MMKPAAEIISYQIIISKNDFEQIINEINNHSDMQKAGFWLGYLISKASAQYIIDKDTEII